MDRKTKIETMLSLINNGVYRVNDVCFLADDFEIVNDTILKFYIYITAYDKKLRYTISLIPLTDIYSIDNFKV